MNGKGYTLSRCINEEMSYRVDKEVGASPSGEVNEYFTVFSNVKDRTARKWWV